MKYKTYWLAALLGPMLVSTAVAVPAKVAAFGWHTAFINNGAVFAMGQNEHGEVAPGIGAEMRTPYFTGTMNAQSVAVNYRRTAVLKNDGTVTLSGLNWALNKADVRTLAASNVTDVALTFRDTFYITNGTLFRLVDGQAPIAIPGATNVLHVAAGFGHVVMLFNDGSVGTWGTNSAGQLGNGTTNSELGAVYKLPGLANIAEVSAGENATALRTASNELIVFGSNTTGQLGFTDKLNKLTPTLVPGVDNVKKLLAGRNQMSIIKNDGTFWTAGWHNYIEGSLYNTSSMYVQIPIGNTVVDGAVGTDYVVVDRGQTGVIEGWGGNHAGKLGDGTNIERHTITPAFYTPIVPPAPPAPVIEPVIEVAPAPVVEPEPTVMAIANPIAADPTPVFEAAPVPSTTELVVAVVVDAVTTVVDAVVSVVTTVVEAVEAVVVAITEVVAPAAPIAEAPVAATEKCNNGWGNGDQCAAGNSANHNNAENAAVAKADPTQKPKKPGKG